MTRTTTLIYTVGFAFVALYGLRMLALALLLPLAMRRRPERADPTTPTPTVTVQLPLYNEAAVAGRAIDAACALRWPAGRLEVQVLDDSTDATRAIVDERVAAWRDEGVDISVLRRSDRLEFKAGALALGLARSRGELLAVFDADFIPPPDFLEACVPYLASGVAVVQARWGHLNQEENWLTRAQSLALDGHFIVEQTCQSRLGLFTNFNGTAGIWRREAIVAAGGWQGDTLTEDFDLSYRAQLAGWRIVVLPEVVVPGELPATLPAFRTQQQRWAQGKAEVLRKLGAALLRAPIHPGRRLMALLSLSGYLAQPILVALLLAAPLAILWPPRFPAWLSVFGLAAFGPPLYYLVAARPGSVPALRRLLGYPVLAVVTAAVSLRISASSIAGLAGISRPFDRTPKTGTMGTADVRPLQRPGGPPAGRLPRPRLSVAIGLDAALMAYAWACALLALRAEVAWLAIYCAVFGLGLGLMVLSEAFARD